MKGTKKIFDRAKQLARYSTKAFDLIPLHKFDDVGGLFKPRPLGKAPIDKDWTRRAYDSAKVRARCLAQCRNVGVRLRPTQLVIDVDPRNGGDVAFDKLCDKLYLNEYAWPRVITGSGGFHCYMSLPFGLAVQETVADYPGVEFKSIGRQVVAAGSRHPNGKPYRWSKDFPSITDGLPMAPMDLLQLIRRERKPRGPAAEPGIYDNDQLASMLAGLDVEQFNGHDKWLNLMLACHHATASDGGAAFIEWSTTAHAFADHEERIQARWDSLDTDAGNAVTYRTLHRIMREHNAGHLIPVPDDDFPEVAPPRRLGKVKPPYILGKVKP